MRTKQGNSKAWYSREHVSAHLFANVDVDALLPYIPPSEMHTDPTTKQQWLSFNAIQTIH